MMSLSANVLASSFRERPSREYEKERNIRKNTVVNYRRALRKPNSRKRSLYDRAQSDLCRSLFAGHLGPDDSFPILATRGLANALKLEKNKLYFEAATQAGKAAVMGCCEKQVL